MNYYIQGDAANADKIRAAFESKEIRVPHYRSCGDSSLIYFSLNKEVLAVTIKALELFEDNPDYKELELLVQPKFKVGDWLFHKSCGVHPILVKDYSEQQGYKVECLGLTYDLQQSIIENEYRFWTIADAKDGDVITNGKLIVIFNKLEEPAYKQHIIAYVGLDLCGRLQITEDTWQLGVDKAMPATKEQRDLLFAKMKEAGYEWDEKKKKLRRIIEPQFKVGDDIKTGSTIETIAEIDCVTRSYLCESGRTIWFENEDMWHLVPKPHYDIKNFNAGMPVLVRPDNDCAWDYSIFSRITDNEYWKFSVCNGVSFTQCIPFEGNEHLLGTTDMPSEEYINW